MEKITINDIDRLAELSKLNFTHEEKEQLVVEVDGIIKMLNQCDDVEIDGEFNSTLQKLSSLRDDLVKEDMTTNDVLINSQCANNGYFSLPKVVD